MTSARGAFVIFDDCFAPSEFHDITDYFGREDFTFIRDGLWKRVFRLADGNCLKGPEYYSRASGEEKARSFPTQKPIDHVIRYIINKDDDLSKIIGEYGDTWDVFSIRPYIYPAGTGLSWHDDSGYAGAFTFYAHPTWRSNWGGELMLKNKAELVASDADGLFVEPRPNRLVIFRSGIPHAIKKVESSAGDSFRMSLSGFFYKEARK